jgi:hypothetical protein
MKLTLWRCDLCQAEAQGSEVPPATWNEYDVTLRPAIRTMHFLVCDACLGKRPENGLRAIFKEIFKKFIRGTNALV